MRLLVIFTAVLLAFGCNSGNNANTDSDANNISLNDGQKWVVNAEMTPFINESNNTLAEYISSSDTDYLSLAKALKNQNSKLIKSCTMKGESHDELHKWLHPHMGLINALAQADSDDTATQIIKDLETSFNTYKTYFE
ncbi:MAG: hypothetical protein ACI9JN_000535 [Bacteroidia bacterium]|jgi:hypothetical protein